MAGDEPLELLEWQARTELMRNVAAQLKKSHAPVAHMSNIRAISRAVTEAICSAAAIEEAAGMEGCGASEKRARQAPQDEQLEMGPSARPTRRLRLRQRPISAAPATRAVASVLEAGKLNQDNCSAVLGFLTFNALEPGRRAGAEKG